MPKIEPVYEPRGQRDAFDGGEDDYEEEEEGSRLPLLIVIGLLVLAAFGGVVWLAYQHGVDRGMKDAPRMVAGTDTQSPSPAYDKIYQKPAPSDQDTANDDTAPPPTTPTFKPQAATPAPGATSQLTAAAPAPSTAAVPAPSTPASNTPIKSTKVAAKPVAPPPVPASVQPQATKPPAKLVPDAQTTSTSPVETKPAAIPAPSTPAPSTPAPAAATSASGDYVLQIGSYKSEDEASSSWKSYKAKHAIAGSHAESIKQVDLAAKGTWYRLRIGGFASKDEAAAFCAKLKAGGGDCIPAKN
jgi:cell division protein FtsN